MNKKKILIVDDNNDYLDLLEMYLYRNYDISTAVNGFEALRIVEDVHPDCILTDIMMPEMDGIKFINALRKISGFEKIPVIATTKFVHQHTTKSLLSVGFADVIEKPVVKENLDRIIIDILGGQS